MLSKAFYSKDAVTLAQDLLGCELVHKTPDGITAGIIVETEAYRQDDPASHSFRGKTNRNAVMFGPSGHAYVYFTYGMHYCFNVVAGTEEFAEAVLIRALKPMQGTEFMKRRRGTEVETNLCSGPGKLVQAMGITKHQNGLDLTEPELFIKPRHAKPQIASSPRIGIKSAAEVPWRFFIPGSPYLTKHKYNRYNQSL